MAEVHIVDIDGEQWNIKDLPLTQRVAILETATQEELDLTNASVTCVKRNGVVTLMIVNKVVIGANSGITLINDLPKKYRPVVPSFRTSLINNATDAYCGQVIMRSEGTMDVYNSSSQLVVAGGAIITMTYVAQD